MDIITVKDNEALVPLLRHAMQVSPMYLSCATRLPDGEYKFDEVLIEISSNPIGDEFAPYGAFVLIKKPQ